MRDSVPSARYSSVCNVLRQWRIWLIPTYKSTDSMIPAANLVLPFSCARECTQSFLIYVCLYCVNSRWSTWVVRVGAPQKIFKAPFPDLKAGHVDHLLSYTKGLFYWTIFEEILRLCSKLHFF